MEVVPFLNPIARLGGFHAHWIPRLGPVDVLGDRDFALRNLAPHHDAILAERFPSRISRHHAEQVHGNRIAVIQNDEAGLTHIHPEVDGLITRLPQRVLGIYVADCAAIYLADPNSRAIALLHSGKKGTEGNILGHAVSLMKSTFGTDPADLVGIVSPCIRPPHYETDFAATIRSQAADVGIVSFFDSHENTATDLSKHYSYRMEKGQTGRMLALLAIE